MFKVCRHSMYISQKSCFTFKTKISTGQLSCLAFQPSSSEHSWWISPSIYSAFSSFKTWTVPPYSFMVMYDKRWGYVLSSEPQTLRQCLNFIDVILQIPICYRRRKRKGNTILKNTRASTYNRALYNITITSMRNYFFTLNTI